MRLSTLVCGAATLAVCGVLACSSGKPVAKAPSPGPSKLEAQARADQEADRSATVYLSEEIRRECRFPENPSELPKFELDQATLRGPDKNVLDDVASCLTDGPLQHRTITIVGRADPRGSNEHNHELGASRAEAARNYLIQKGVSEQKLLVTSRGEEGATGSGEASWSLDRRVDLVLGDRTERTSINQNPPANAPKPSNANASPGSPYADQSEGGPASGKVTGTSGPGTDSVPGK